MRALYLAYRGIIPTASGKFSVGKFQTLSGKSPTEKVQALTGAPSRNSSLAAAASAFRLPWSHYVLLLKAHSPQARAFYEEESLRSGWSVRTLDRQMSTLFYACTALSRNKSAMLRKRAKVCPVRISRRRKQLKTR
jgi:hypothetical protein